MSVYNRRRAGGFVMMGLLTVSLVTRCGKPPMRQVTGTVSLNGKLVEHCKVGFFPDVVEFNPDRHGFGFGVTDAEGRFTIQHPQGEKGIWSGTYKVTFTLWVDRNANLCQWRPSPARLKVG